MIATVYIKSIWYIYLKGPYENGVMYIQFVNNTALFTLGPLIYKYQSSKTIDILKTAVHIKK